MNLPTKQKQTSRMSLWLLGEGREEGIVRELGMDMYTMLYLKWITNKVLLYRTRNCAQCYVTSWMRGEFGGEWIHVWLSPFALHLAQRCLLINYTPIQNRKLKRLCAFTAGGASSIPAQETNILQPVQHN